MRARSRRQTCRRGLRKPSHRNPSRGSAHWRNETQSTSVKLGAMAFTIRRVEYYYANVRDELGAAYRVLSQLAARGVDLLAFTAVPSGPNLAQFALFPADPRRLVAEGRAAGLALDGPHHALLVQGEHERLVDAGVDVFASSGVTDGRGSFGYVIYVREDQFTKAARALDL